MNSVILTDKIFLVSKLFLQKDYEEGILNELKEKLLIVPQIIRLQVKLADRDFEHLRKWLEKLPNKHDVMVSWHLET